MTTALEVISTRIPKELKDEMGNLDVDWAEYLRSAIEQKVRTEKIKRACGVMDELREKTKGVSFDSVKVIREARNAR